MSEQDATFWHTFPAVQADKAGYRLVYPGLGSDLRSASRGSGQGESSLPHPGRRVGRSPIRRSGNRRDQGHRGRTFDRVLYIASIVSLLFVIGWGVWRYGR
jgi:hypothetical protein